MMLDVTAARMRFPALQRTLDDRAVAYLDGPGGTQVPHEVIDAMSSYLEGGVSNAGGTYVTGQETTQLINAARLAMADLFNAQPKEIAFGQNMSSLTFSLSRSLAQTWEPGDEIVLTRLDHDANISPWLRAAAERDVVVRWLDFDPDTCQLDLEGLDQVLTERTRLVAVTAASNGVGTVVDVKRAAKAAHRFNAMVFVDGVHFTPHGLVDVKDWNVDFFACSAYKFFGPHVGVLYRKEEHLTRLDAYKVQAAPDEIPEKWQVGTQNYEGLAGLTAAVDYIASLGEGTTRRDCIESAARSVSDHENTISEHFLGGVAEIPGLKIFGTGGSGPRVPTFALDIKGQSPSSIAERLGAEGIFVRAGHFYAVALAERLGVLDQGGLVRIGFVHYNTLDEVDRVLDSLNRIAASDA